MPPPFTGAAVAVCWHSTAAAPPYPPGPGEELGSGVLSWLGWRMSRRMPRRTPASGVWVGAFTPTVRVSKLA